MKEALTFLDVAAIGRSKAAGNNCGGHSHQTELCFSSGIVTTASGQDGTRLEMLPHVTVVLMVGLLWSLCAEH
jgi:hypothetical protein